MNATATPSVEVVDPELIDRLRSATAERATADQAWRDAITDAVESGASLRAVAILAGISHTAVKFIAHGRPER